MKKKASMNYLDVVAWIRKNEDLIGSTVQNVYYKDGLMWMKLKGKGSGTKALIAEPGRRIHLTPSPPEAPERLHPFAGGLRKFLKSAKLTSIKTVGYDRVVEMNFSKGGEVYKLMIELVPRGVIALLDPENKILYANEYKEMRDRSIKRGELYKPPPGPTFDPFNDLEELGERIKKGKDVVRGLVIGQKVPGDVAEEVLFRAGVAKDKKPSEVSLEELERIKAKIREVYEEALKGRAYLVRAESEPVAFEPFEPRLFISQGYHASEGDLDQIIDEYFANVKSEELEETLEERVRKEVEKLRKAMEEQLRLAEEYKKLSENYEKLATQLAANYAEIEEVLKDGKEYIMKFEDKEIVLKPDTNLDEYIRSLFSKSKEYEKKYKRALKAYEELKEEMDKVEEKVKEEIAKEIAKSRRREWYEKYHWLITSSGLLAIGGKDASQNEAVVRRYLEDDDIFMHAEVQGAPAVVLKTEGKEVTEKDLREAAFLTACYSKAWKEGRGSVDVFYVKGSQVSKSPPPGQYVAKGAFIIRVRENTSETFP